VDALRAADERDEQIAVPVYSHARRERLEELSIVLDTDGEDELAPRWLLGDEPQPRLELPAESLWIVEQVSLWTPKLPDDLEGELAAEARRTAPRPPAWVALALVGVLVAIIVLALARLQ
jgi:hypothetical protein